MKKYLTYSIAALFVSLSVSIAAPDKTEMEAKEKSAWQFYKDKKADDFKKLVGANYTGVYGNGISDLAKELSDMQKLNMTSFALSNYNLVSPDADTAVSSYKVKYAGTFEGQDVSGDYYSSSVWRKQNGEWRVIMHTNVKAEAATDAQKKE